VSSDPVNLSRRSTDLEIMDDLSCSGVVVEQTLRELDVINRWLGGNRVTLEGIREMIPAGHSSPLSIADLGCGSGDLLKRIAKLGRKLGIPMKLIGIDANPHIVEYARRHSTDYPEISFEVLNVLSSGFTERQFDIITGTLFFHHFDDDALVELLRQLRGQARVGLVINDIHRHPAAYHSIRLLTRSFSSSSMVRFDAPLSVRRAFTRTEWIRLLADSGISQYSLVWKWAFRWKICIPTQ
jgi:2-polyprenyl-3-methyl-5-hydroxy-6-metoxy-1,4-benzoquinol methylase